MKNQEKFLATGDAARVLNVSTSTVRRLVHDGTLSATQVGGRFLFEAKQVEELAEEARRAAETVRGKDG
jgi:excisionase family DNA binding protein